jgi:hypothetical protein
VAGQNFFLVCDPMTDEAARTTLEGMGRAEAYLAMRQVNAVYGAGKAVVLSAEECEFLGIE